MSNDKPSATIDFMELELSTCKARLDATKTELTLARDFCTTYQSAAIELRQLKKAKNDDASKVATLRATCAQQVTDLELVTTELNEAQHKLGIVRSDFDKVTKEQEELTHERDMLRKKLKLATRKLATSDNKIKSMEKDDTCSRCRTRFEDPYWEWHHPAPDEYLTPNQRMVYILKGPIARTLKRSVLLSRFKICENYRTTHVPLLPNHLTLTNPATLIRIQMSRYRQHSSAYVEPINMSPRKYPKLSYLPCTPLLSRFLDKVKDQENNVLVQLTKIVIKEDAGSDSDFGDIPSKKTPKSP